MRAIGSITHRAQRSARIVLLALAAGVLLAGVSDESAVTVTAQDAGSGARLQRIAHLGGQSKAVAARDDVVLLGVGPRVEVHRLDGDGLPMLQSAVPFDRVVVDIDWPELDRPGADAFVLSEDGMLTALDIADESAPIVLGAWRVPSDVAGTVDRIVRQDDTLVASGSEGIIVADVSDPANPRWLGDLAFDEPITDLHIDLPHATVLTRWASLTVVDVADPAAPRRLGQMSLGADSDPGMGAELGSDAQGMALALRAGIASVFVVAYPNQEGGARVASTNDVPPKVMSLVTVDVSDPGQPRALHRVDLSDRVDVGLDDLLWSGDRLFGLVTRLCLHCTWGGLIEFDVSAPAEPLPSPVTEIDVGRSVELAATGDHLVSAQLDGGMHVIDPRSGESTGESPFVVASRDVPIDPRTIAVNERHVVFGDGRHIGESGIGLIQRGAGPVLDLGSILVERSLCGGACEVALRDERAFVADENEHFLVVDLASDAAPRIVQRMELSGRPDQIALTDGLALVLVDRPEDGPGSRLEVIDTSDAGQARHVGSYAPIPGAADVAVHRSTSSGRDCAVVAGAQGMHIIDLEDPTRPQLVGNAGVFVQGPNVRPPFRTVATHEDHAYFVNSVGTLVVANLSDPVNPKIIGSRIDHGRDGDAIVNVAAAAVTDGIVYALIDNHIEAYDVHDPRRPYQVVSVPGASVGMPGYLRDVAIFGDELYVSGDRAGIGMFELVRPPLQYRVYLPLASTGR